MKGQAAVEWMVILGVAILVLGVMLSMNEESLQFFETSLRVSKAKASLSQLKNGADFVYSQGSGAKTRVYITIPAATNFSVRTLAAGQGEITATVYVRGKPEVFDAYTDANLSGTLPQKSGAYNIDIGYDGDDVVFSRSAS